MLTITSQSYAISWEKLQVKNGFSPRDSAGEFLFNGKMYLLGGWQDSYRPNLVDVYSTRDGIHFQLENLISPIHNSDLAVHLTHNNKIFIISGWIDGRLSTGRASNEIFISEDGKSFKLLGYAPFSPRVGAAGVVFKNRIYIIGGNEEYFYGSPKTLKSDVWSSADGINWILETKKPGFSPRAFAQAFVHQEKLCIAGGGNYSPFAFSFNEIWCSKNGKKFYKIKQKKKWPSRIWFSLLKHKDYVWVLGGDRIEPSKKLNDVWISKNLITWKKIKFKKIWSPRHEHSAFIVGDEIYIMAGHADPLNNEVWKFTIPHNFYSKIGI